jgi:hypothetical protein
MDELRRQWDAGIYIGDARDGETTFSHISARPEEKQLSAKQGKTKMVPII